ncbi:MAG: phosphodiester glycosidase family protein [Firmicutes bacterium]|nr:phosphodiester glycosidase family protein [Bacillota bacterium]MDY5856757.1 phosphodiester glycosidase family protein [Anaerovoracaceae bacterium]
MKQRRMLRRVMSAFLCVMMVIMMQSTAAFAAIDNYNKDYQSETHTVFKHTEQTLAPGVTNYTNYAYSNDGKQMVYYVTTADLTRDDVVAQVAYKDMQNEVYGMDKLSNMVACANEKYSDPTNPQFISEYYSVVSACNGDGYNMTTGEPSGVFIMGGNVKKDWDKSSNPVFLAILKDGTAVIDNTQEAWNACKEAGIQEAIDIFGSNLVWDGKDVTADVSGSYNTDRHSRTMVGITEDGKLVICVLDGRQEPFSCGGSMHELAQIMLEAGCVRAFNLDGGGSTTFMAKNEGSNQCTIQNRPSDGSERSISNGIIIASTAVPSDTFDHVSMVAKDEYVTVGSSTAITVTGVSPAGTAAEIPEGITYEVENGTYENGVLTASAVGDVVVTAKLDGEAVGSVAVHCVVPEVIKFASDTITVPYGKTATLELIATYGLNEVVTNSSNFSFALENEAVGTIEGMKFTAADESAGVSNSVITATFVGTELSANATLSLGKGSEVIFDFEDGTTNGFKTGYVNYNYYLPNSTTSVATAETGKVHSGNHSLAINIDYSNSQESGYMMTALYRVGDNDEESDRAYVGAQRIGAWIYIPDEYVSLWARWVLYPIDSVNEDGTVNIAASSITSNAMDNTAGGTGVVYSFSESGWHYLSCDFSKYSGAMWRDGYYCMQFYISDRDGASYDYYAKNAHNINGNFTIYIDDITVDYSSVVDDREAPIFSGVNYATHGMSDAAVLNDGASIAHNTVDFTATVAEDTTKANATGIDVSTAKAYVDGNEVACTYKNGSISMDSSVDFSAGQHTIKFSICDKQGNYASIIRKVNITSGDAAAIKVVAHDPSLDRILFGSLYYVDVVATDIADVQTVTTTLNLDSMNSWELDHMEVADGFEATYTYEEEDKILHLTINKTGDVSATGEQTLVSIPVRVWELNNVGSRIGGSNSVLEEGNKYTYAWFKSQNEYWRVAVEVRIQQGEAVLVNGDTDTFTGESVFCDTEAWAIQKFMVETQEGKDYKAAWDGGHIHSAHAIDDVAATCTEDGYTGRTYCDECKSIVDWGTTVPATRHSYDFIDGVLKCTACGELFSGEWTDGKLYKDGVTASDGWVGDSYYVNGEKLTGVQMVTAPDGSDEFYYDFGENGICEGKVKYNGLFFDETEGVWRYAQLGKLSGGWKDINGEWYCFSNSTLAARTGHCHIDGPLYMDFEETGKLISGVWVRYTEGMRYFYGPGYYKAASASDGAYAWYEVDGTMYCFDNRGYRYENRVALLCEPGKSVDPNLYQFDEDGKSTFASGIVSDKLYIDGYQQKAYQLVEFEGNYYFINDGHRLAKNKRLYMSEQFVAGKTYPDGTPMQVGYYEFDADGKMILKNGPEGDYFYKNGVRQSAYQLVEFEGSYYFINDGHRLAKSMRLYMSEQFVAGKTYSDGTPMQVGYYEFDADGKMILKNGPEGDYFYKNGVRQNAYQLVEFEGNYYFINDGHKLAKNIRLYMSEQFIAGKTYSDGTPMLEGYYNFDEDGKMIL